MKKRSSRRYSDDEYEDDTRDDRDSGYRSDGHRSRRSDVKKPVDGPDEDFDEINNRPRRKRSRARRRDDDDKYGKHDGHHRSSRKRGGIEYGDGAIPPVEQPPPATTYTDPMAGAAAMGGAFAATQAFQHNGAFGSPAPSNAAYGSPLPATGAYGSPQASSSAYGSPQPFQPQPNIAGSVNSSFSHDPNQPPARSTSTLRGGMSTGYVPYAHIYGGPTHALGFPPPQSDVGSVQPTYMNQVAAPKVAPPPSDYQQNPYAQEALPGTQPGYMPNPNEQRSRQYESTQHDDRYDTKTRSGYDSDETARQSRRERRRSRKSRRDRTPSQDSYYSEESYDDRNRSRRRRSRPPPPPRHDSPPVVAPQSKSTVKGPFDTSQRGLGYSAVGALAGGLIGSEFGKGPMPRALATAVGAIAANVFQARERRKEEAREKEYHLRKAGYYSD
ncbi:hypothetical protein CERZMDRAFT_106174 [Cercospora zeae-maydis SCOH1-5]|uniref:Glycine zipper 2TM domain-containing protein n=1 Tax=Cercospora zeae-maydis SCOH1-5 TaxID=717836 RepID=A0A6A6FG79_9PEZI|nr:hypothetical protein CERZMDRAFT_106174 [Cercospora zeae-maydis SCOH1-5]